MPDDFMGANVAFSPNLPETMDVMTQFDPDLVKAVLTMDDDSARIVVKAALQKVRKKPITVAAVKWNPDLDASLANTGYIDYGDLVDGYANGVPYILTLEGPMRATPGDWIIIGVAGERYFCKHDIFVATYDLVS